MIRFRKIRIVCAGLVFSISFAASSVTFAQASPAEELTRVLPDDVLGFVATSGGESLKAGFEKSLLGRMWHDPGVKAFGKSLEDALLPKIQQEMGNPDAAGAIEDVLSYAKLALGRPIVVGAARKQGGEGPPVFGFAILNAGPRKAEIVSALSKLESLDKKGDIVDINIGSAKMRGPKDADDVPLYWGWVGDYLVAAVNDSEGLTLKHLSAPRTANPAYFKAVPGTDDAIVVHYDIQGITGIVNSLAQSRPGQVPVGPVMAVLRELGLSNIKAITARMGFAGPDMVSNSLVEMPAPRTGLFANLKPINMSMFDMVDAGAMNASVVNCDLGGMYDTVFSAVKAAAGEDFAEVEGAIAAVESELKFKIRQGLLESLSGEMVFYSLPSGMSTQSPMGGFVFIAGLKDAELWEKSLGALGEFAAAASGGMVQVSSQQQGDRTVHTWAIVPLAMAQIMPTWTVVENRTIIASSPAILNGAAEQLGSGAKSIRGTEGFKTATAELPGNVISLRYSDSKLQFTQLMTALQQFWPMATMFAAKAELKLPMILPNLSHIAQDMGPSCQYSWFDDLGLRSRYRGSGIEPSLGAVAGSAFALGVTMPALARVRQVAKGNQRVRAKASMAMIEVALETFELDCGRYPDDAEGLEALIYAPAKLGQTWKGPYLKQSELTDPWGNPFVYVADGEHNPGSFDLVSYGADGQEGGDGDDEDLVND